MSQFDRLTLVFASTSASENLINGRHTPHPRVCGARLAWSGFGAWGYAIHGEEPEPRQQQPSDYANAKDQPREQNGEQAPENKCDAPVEIGIGAEVRHRRAWRKMRGGNKGC